MSVAEGDCFDSSVGRRPFEGHFSLGNGTSSAVTSPSNYSSESSLQQEDSLARLAVDAAPVRTI
jgi:hypothetical protein